MSRCATSRYATPVARRHVCGAVVPLEWVDVLNQGRGARNERVCYGGFAMSRTRSVLARVLLLAGATSGCPACLGAAKDADAGPSGSGGSDSASAGGSTTTSGGSAVDPEAVTRVARLTHAQYNSTVQDLLGISDTPADAFAPDALNGFAFDTSVDLEVDARLGPQYRAAAEALAERAVSEDAVFDRIVPCSAEEADCSDEFIAGFGQRAFRRPLSEDERTAFAELFEKGPSLVASGDDFKDGVQLVVEAMLQAPQFLYRTELSEEPNADGMIALDSWEVATRLSYFLHGSMPTEELFEQASADELGSADEVASAIQALLESERATAQLVSFHAQAWDFGRYSRIAPDKGKFPEVPDDIVDSTRLASERFVQEVITNGGGFAEFLTAPYAFADAGLAGLYGVDAPSSMTRIELNPEERKGYLMQVGFLASHAYAVATDPIHRGLFVVRQLLCRDIPDPPAGASMTPLPETDEPIETTREEIELLTGQAGCFTCHSQINPPGFALEGFDAVGQVRTTENDVGVDTSGTISLDDTDISFSGPVELVDALAESQEARACYASKWLEFAYGRFLGAADQVTALELATTPLSVHELVARVGTTEAFVHRKRNEVGR